MVGWVKRYYFCERDRLDRIRRNCRARRTAEATGTVALPGNSPVIRVTLKKTELTVAA